MKTAQGNLKVQVFYQYISYREFNTGGYNYIVEIQSIEWLNRLQGKK